MESKHLQSVFLTMLTEKENKLFRLPIMTFLYSKVLTAGCRMPLTANTTNQDQACREHVGGWLKSPLSVDLEPITQFPHLWLLQTGSARERKVDLTVNFGLPSPERPPRARLCRAQRGTRWRCCPCIFHGASWCRPFAATTSGPTSPCCPPLPAPRARRCSPGRRGDPGGPEWCTCKKDRKLAIYWQFSRQGQVSFKDIMQDVKITIVIYKYSALQIASGFGNN